MYRSLLTILSPASSFLVAAVLLLPFAGCERDPRPAEERRVIEIETPEGPLDPTEEPDDEQIDVAPRDES